MPTEMPPDGPGSTTSSSNANSKKTAPRRSSAGKNKNPKPSTVLATLPVTSSPPKFPYYHPDDNEFAIALPQAWIDVPIAKKRIRQSRESSSEELQLRPKTPTSPVKPPLKKIKQEPDSHQTEQQQSESGPAPRRISKGRQSIRNKKLQMQKAERNKEKSSNRFGFASNGAVTSVSNNSSSKSTGKTKPTTTTTTTDRCCECSITSTCSTNRCPCKKAKRDCDSCCGFGIICKNLLLHNNNKNGGGKPNNSKNANQKVRAPSQTCHGNTSAAPSGILRYLKRRPKTNPVPPPPKSDNAETIPTPPIIVGVARRLDLDFEAAALPSSSSPSSEAANEDTPSSSQDDQNENASVPPDSGNQQPPTSPNNITENGDLPGAIISPANHQLDLVYGDHIHENPGFHLNGGIADDRMWQEFYKRLIPLPPSHYNVPRAGVGKDFVNTLSSIMNDVIDRKCNMEKFLTFQMVILQRIPAVKTMSDVRRRLKWRLDLWKSKQYTVLVEDTIRSMEASLSKARGSTTPAQRAKAFDAKVKRGKLRSAVRYITDREGGGVLYPQDIDDKSGKTVIDALRDKHPPMREPGAAAMPTFDTTPCLVDLDITEGTVEAVASKLSGSAGLGGMDSVALKHILLQHGGASKILRQTVAKFARWMSNSYPPWAAYRALQWNRLVALGKNPGIRPLGIGDIWRRLLAKCNLAVSGPAAKDACGADQLCAGLSAGIEGAIHGMSQTWTESDAIDRWGFLLVDARNAFNEINRISMLWTIRHEWPAGARFAFNCYRHYSPLLCRDPDGHSFTLFSREGVTQGDPLSMFAYGVGILPLIRQLKAAHPSCIQPWYADDAGSAGTFESIDHFFADLVKIGPDFGYFPEPSKSVLIVRPSEIQHARFFFNDQRRRGFQITTGHRYLGGFIGDLKTRDEWLSTRLSDWTSGILELADAAQKYPQSAYAGLQKSLQHEWAFLQRVLPDIGNHFETIEEAIADVFLPALFGEQSFDENDYRRPLTALPVRFAGLGLPNPTKSSSANYEASTLVCSHLIQAVQGKISFQSADHLSTKQDVLAELRPRREEAYKSTMTSLLSALPNADGKGMLSRSIGRAGDTGQWLSCMPSTVSGTELGCDEFRDALRLRYGRTPAFLPEKCDGCGSNFTLEHAFTCKVGGLIIQRHDEINQELANLSRMALKPSSVRAEPLISTGSLCKTSNPTQDNSVKLQDPCDTRARGDLLVRSLWKNGSDCIIDVRVTDLDAPSYASRDPAKVLASHEQQKKKKYLEDCLQQRRSFSPFVISADGLLGFEAKNILKQLSRLLVTKWERPYSVVCGLVRARMSIACVRANHLCLRGSRIPFSKTSRRIQWSDGAGVGLFEVDRS